MNKKLKDILNYFPMKIQEILILHLQKYFVVQEIRIRVNQPICLLADSRNIILDNVIITQNDIQILFENICEHSVYSYQNEINMGFITLKGGNRVGICGTAVTERNQIVNIKNITSMNFRIANDFIGCAEKIMCDNARNIIVAGPPASGKTTLLRDMARIISNQKNKVCIVDERYEISGVNGEFDLGVMSDCLRGYEKSYGISICIRTLSPDYIVFDEIGSYEECESVFESFNSGVNIITSVHCYTKEQFFSRPICQKLLESNYFDEIIFLDRIPGKVKEILRLDKSICV